ncbi:DNA adenine methylase [bacterium]|nr:DNA adenine methylase [bacterium]
MTMMELQLFEEFKTEETVKPVNVASVPQRSPFRYPGGKTWLVPLFRRWMKSFDAQPETLIEPFVGGGIISLTTAFERLANEVIMVELDEQIASVWESILNGNADWLAKEILSFTLNHETVKTVLAQRSTSKRKLAFQTILKNRINHGGILAEGSGIIKNGENGKGIHSRWYPQTIAKRIQNIEFVSKYIRFYHADAFQVMAEYCSKPNIVYFIDPPYTAGGKRAGSRLYKYSEIDHEKLFGFCKALRGDFLMTYDNAEEVHELANRHGFQTKPIAMKNTHHAQMTELLIGRDLSWLTN